MPLAYIYGLDIGENDHYTLQIPPKIPSIHKTTNYDFNFVDIRYVGSTVTTIQRLSSHFEEDGTTMKNEWINEIKSKGKMPFMRVFCSCDENDRFVVENSFIEAFKSLLPENCVNSAFSKNVHEGLVGYLKSQARTMNDFPILYKNKKYYQSNCSTMFLTFYFGRKSLRSDSGVYMGDGMVVYPNGFIFNEDET